MTFLYQGQYLLWSALMDQAEIKKNALHLLLVDKKHQCSSTKNDDEIELKVDSFLSTVFDALKSMSLSFEECGKIIENQDSFSAGIGLGTFFPTFEDFMAATGLSDEFLQQQEQEQDTNKDTNNIPKTILKLIYNRHQEIIHEEKWQSFLQASNKEKYLLK